MPSVRTCQFMADNKLAKHLGYSPSPEKDNDYLLVAFNNKREKWEWMKQNGFSEFYLAIKESFPDAEEPVVQRRKNRVEQKARLPDEK